MSNLSIKEKYHLPDSIKVSLIPSKTGGFTIILPEYSGCVTFTENINELVDIVNDVVLTYFRVSRGDAVNADFIYVPSKPTISKVIRSSKPSAISETRTTQFVQYYPYNYA